MNLTRGAAFDLGESVTPKTRQAFPLLSMRPDEVASCTLKRELAAETFRQNNLQNSHGGPTIGSWC